MRLERERAVVEQLRALELLDRHRDVGDRLRQRRPVGPPRIRLVEQAVRLGRAVLAGDEQADVVPTEVVLRLRRSADRGRGARRSGSGRSAATRRAAERDQRRTLERRRRRDDRVQRHVASLAHAREREPDVRAELALGREPPQRVAPGVVVEAQRLAARQIEIAGRRARHAAGRQHVDDVQHRAQPPGLARRAGQQRARALTVAVVAHPELALPQRDERGAPHGAGRADVHGRGNRAQQLVLAVGLNEAVEAAVAHEAIRGRQPLRRRRRRRGDDGGRHGPRTGGHHEQSGQDAERRPTGDAHRGVRPRCRPLGRRVV